jgi:Domain of unknown function (DUF5060)
MIPLHGAWLGIAMVGMVLLPARALAGGTYAKLEVAFELPQLSGNPFDFTQNDVKVTFLCPDSQRVMVPAFFDGGQTWRVRFTPVMPGKHAIVAVTLNGKEISPLNLQVRVFDVAGTPQPGFVRIDPEDPLKFAFDDGTPYYPVGYNLGWRNENGPPLMDSLSRMGQAGVNWTRIWMSHWDGKNLDWAQRTADQPKLGELNLATARLWDQIVNAAEANNIHFHLVLQHHGQYSTRTNPNWAENPWNKVNGGWLESPIQFFTDPKAIALTKSKFRYIIARWGYSPSIMAWELFNEVEFTDAFEKNLDAVAAWHAEMAAFIREQDPYHHLITTSSDVNEPKLWPATDYYEAHTYPPDILSAMAVLEADKLPRPYFFGEIGSGNSSANQDAATLQRILWASIMSGASGAAQFWYWDIVEPKHLLGNYAAAQRFIARSGVLKQRGLKPIEVIPQTPKLTALSFASGMGWGAGKQTEFSIKPSGFIEGLGGMAAYLQGNGKNHDYFPVAVFHVEYPEDGTFSIRLDEMTADGATLEVQVDGKEAAQVILAAPPVFGPSSPQGPQRRNPRLDTTLEVPINAGKHTIQLHNSGGDWVHIRQITLTPYVPQLAVCAKGNDQFAALWIYRREATGDESISGTLRIPGLAEGTYRVTWWDTTRGEVLGNETANATESNGLTLKTPPIGQHIAAWIVAGDR